MKVSYNMSGNYNNEDRLIWVDLNDNEIGSGEKLDTHKRNILHRAFSVFLYSNGKILIQP